MISLFAKRSLPPRRKVLACLAVLFLLAPTGCRQSVFYQANNLPPDIMAPHVGSLRRVDLSQFARHVGNSKRLRVGDNIEVSIVTGVNKGSVTSAILRLDENGVANVPLIGAVRLAGLELVEAERAISEQSIRAGKFVNPNVTVKLDKRRTNRVTVVGAVQEPNTYELPAGGSDLLDAFAAAGGLAQNADTIVEIRHPPEPAPVQPAGYRGGPPLMNPPRTMRIDLAHPAPADYRLRDGSTVMVMTRPKRFVHVIGLVNRPDQIEIPAEQDLRLLDAISQAGGRTLSIADKVHVIRKVPDRAEPVVIEVSIKEAKRNGKANFRLAASDVISVEETPTTFVVGTLKDFIRFGFTSAIPGI